MRCPDAIVPDAVWRGHGDASALRVRIVDTLRDGRVLIHRLVDRVVSEHGETLDRLAEDD